ncbi:MAG: signal peptidase I, partial [Candidatus Aenigmarchaeota archaeon]|nr:signal peptidase I [Candidatus Aenigmarchaeota archaeon]
MARQKKRRPILAVLASFGSPGLGQLYNGQLVKAILVYFIFLSFYPLLSLKIFGLTLFGLLIIGCIALIIFIAVLVDAFINARKLRLFELRKYNRWYVYVAIILIHVFGVMPLVGNVIFPRPFKAYKIPSGAMLPAIQPGDHIIVDLTFYKETNPQRGDIVVFVYPEDPEKDSIKRIIGLPGETLEIREKKVFINGQALIDPWGVHMDMNVISRSRDNFGPVTIPKGQYFVMGDNRDNSQDSRFLGFIEGPTIKGKALYIYWAKDKGRIGQEL